MKKKKLLSITMVFVMIFTILAGVNQTAYAANGDCTGAAGFTVNAYPNGVRINMIPVPGATDYKVYMSTDGALTTDFSSASCLFSSSTYFPYAYFTSGDMDKIKTTTAVTINNAATYFFYYVTNGTAIATKYEARTQASGTSWTSAGNYDTSWYTPGSSPYTISSAAQLAGLAYLVNGGTNFSGETVNLGASVDVSAYPWTAIGNGALKSFEGTFNGQNNVVDGIYINATTNFQGLFGRTYTGNIKNLGVVNGLVKSSNGVAVGGVVGYADSSVIQDCYNTGYVAGACVGGVVGQMVNTGSVQNCYNTGSITGSNADIGGIVGSYEDGISVQNCYNTGSVTATGESSMNAGGVAGGASGSVQNCYNTGSVTAVGAGSYNIGGVAGKADSIQNCYNIGSVTGSGTYVGGVAGVGSNLVQYCYNMGNVTGGSPAGGVAASGTIKNSYANCNVNSSATKIYYDSNGSNGTFTDAATCFSGIGDSANFCAAPAKYADGGVFSNTNKVNNGYPVLKAFGYTGDDTSIDTEFSINGLTYTISNAYQLDLVRNYLSAADNTKIFQLAGNIDISPAQYNQQITGTADGADSWKPIGTTSSPFYAALDGVKYSISGLYINSASMYQGLFGCALQTAGGGSAIKNVGINGTLVSSSGYVGSIVGDADFNFSVQNCYNTGSVTASGNRVGGVVGSASDVNSVQNCYNTGNVTGAGTCVGGVVGYTVGSVQNCYNIGSISGTGVSKLSFGGVVGYADFGASVQYCYNTGSVSDSGINSQSVGGVLGYARSSSSVQNCYNTGSVTDTGSNSQGVGGIVGYTAGSVQNCYNTGIVSDTGSGSKYVGGVVGMATSTILNCYYCGYNGGVGNSIDNTAADTPGQTTPFTKLVASSIAAGSQTNVIEDNASVLNGASDLGDAFAVGFGAYSSSNTSAATVSGTTVNGVAVGNANITGTITITQNNLNMAPASTGWLSTTQKITAQVIMPLTVSASYTATINLNKDGSAWTGSGKTITLQQASETLTPTTEANGIFTASVTNGTWKISADGVDTGRTVVINNAAASQDLNYFTVQFAVTERGTATGSTISATYNSSAINSGKVVLGGQQLVITAVGQGSSNYTYAWSGTGTSGETTAALTIDTLSSSVNAACDVSSAAPNITTASLPDGTVGTAYFKGLSALTMAPLTWEITTGVLPAGLHLDPVAGVINGTPTEIGTSSFTVTATSALGTKSKPLSIKINGMGPAITTTSLPDGTVNTAYSQTLAATGTAPITWDITTGSLPAGLSLDPNTGAINGTPTAEGESTFTVQASNSNGSDTKTYTLTVSAAPATYTLTITAGSGRNIKHVRKQYLEFVKKCDDIDNLPEFEFKNDVTEYRSEKSIIIREYSTDIIANYISGKLGFDAIALSSKHCRRVTAARLEKLLTVP